MLEVKAGKWKKNMAKITEPFPFCPPRCWSQQGGVGMAGILWKVLPALAVFRKLCPHAFLLPRLVEEIQGDTDANITITVITQC